MKTLIFSWFSHAGSWFSYHFYFQNVNNYLSVFIYLWLIHWGVRRLKFLISFMVLQGMVFRQHVRCTDDRVCHKLNREQALGNWANWELFSVTVVILRIQLLFTFKSCITMAIGHYDHILPHPIVIWLSGCCILGYLVWSGMETTMASHHIVLLLSLLNRRMG